MALLSMRGCKEVAASAMERDGVREGSSVLKMKWFKVFSFPALYMRVVKEQLNIIVCLLYCDSDTFFISKREMYSIKLVYAVFL